MSARKMLNDIFSNPQPIVRSIIDDTMSKALQAQAERERQAKLWQRNPLTGAAVNAGRYNDRSGREMVRV